MNRTIPILLRPWMGEMGGTPPLEKVTVDELRLGLLEGLVQAKEELEALKLKAKQGLTKPAGHYFLEFVLPLDQLGEGLSRVQALYSNFSLSFSSKELRDLRKEMEPRLAQWRTELYGDQDLYQQLLAAQKDTSLDLIQQRLTQRLIEFFQDAGTHLTTEVKADVAEINQRLSTLFTEFSDRILADEEDHVTWLSAEHLEGLPKGWCSSAKQAAKEHGKAEEWAVRNTRSAVEPFLTLSPHRHLREQVWHTFYKRGELRESHATLPLAQEILKLRAQRAKLLGFETQAHQVLARTMAKTPEAAMGLLKEVWGPAVSTFKRELHAMTKLAHDEGFEGELAPWDVRFYAEKVRRRDYNLDPNEICQYFSLEKLCKGMFWAAEQCFSWKITPAEVTSPHPDISVWHIHHQDGQEVGLFYFDPYARAGKRSGAWMSVYRPQLWDHEQNLRIPPLVLNTCNFLKAEAGQPTLLTMNDARTLFHEFGHAMHGLASKVAYKYLAGTSVVRDFVEFPSQLNERWLNTSELREKFCTHIQTNSSLPEALIKKLEEATHAGSGFATLEYLASAVVDLSLHLAGEAADSFTVEERVLGEWGLPSQMVMRHRTPQFAHIFSGEGYASGYYCYLWADMLVADASELFQEKGFYEKELCTQYYEQILSQGSAVDSAQAFRALRGRDPQVTPLLKDRGLLNS